MVVAGHLQRGDAVLQEEPVYRDVRGAGVKRGAGASEGIVRILEVALGDAIHVGDVGDAAEDLQPDRLAMPDDVAAAEGLVEAQLVHLAQGEGDAAAELQMRVAAEQRHLRELVLETEALQPHLADVGGTLTGGGGAQVGRGGEVHAVELQVRGGIAHLAVQVQLVQPDPVFVVRVDAVLVVPAVLEQGGVGDPEALLGAGGGGQQGEQNDEGGGDPPGAHGDSLFSVFPLPRRATTCSSSSFSVPLVKPVWWKARRPSRSMAWRKGSECRGLKRPRTLLSPSSKTGMRNLRSATKRRTSATVLGSSMLTARTARPSFSYLSRRRCRMGSSCLQGAHQVAQKLRRTTFPS